MTSAFITHGVAQSAPANAGVLGNDTDANGDPLRATLVTGTTNGSLTFNVDGTFTYTPNMNFAGTDSFTYRVNDGSADSNTATATITVNPVNDPPLLTSATLAVSEGATVALSPANFGITDPDSASFTYTLSGIAGGYFQLSSAAGTPITSFTSAELSGGLVQFVDNGDEVAPAFSVTVNDGAANSNTLAATISYTPVNDPPLTTPVTLAPIAEDSGPRLITQAQLLVNASDLEGNPLTAMALAISAGAGTLVDNGDGTWTYTPALNDDTAVSFSYTVSDGNGGSVAGSATLDITPVNDAPVITSNGGGSTALTSVAENTTAGTTVTATDIEGDPIQYSIVGGADAARFQIDSVTGVLTFVAAPNFESAADLDRDNVYEVVLQAADGQGGAATQLLRIAVTNVNENPMAVTDQIVTAAGQAIVVTETTLLANDSDVDGDTLRVISVSAPTSGTLLRTASGDYLYTPAAGFTGADSFTYTVADAGGLTATAQVSVAVAITQPEPDPFATIPSATPAPQAPRQHRERLPPAVGGTSRCPC
jgi:VCBS repeat-containing protein